MIPDRALEPLPAVANLDTLLIAALRSLETHYVQVRRLLRTGLTAGVASYGPEARVIITRALSALSEAF